MKRFFPLLICVFVCGAACAQKPFKSSKYKLMDTKIYELNGNLIEDTWSDGYSCKYFYDEDNNPVRSVQNTGVTTEYTVISSSTILEKWSNGIEKQYLYDLNHNLVREYWKTSDETSFTDFTEYSFDTNNRELRYSIYNKKGVVKTYWNYYDETGLLVSRTSTDGEEYFFDYEFYESGKVKVRYNYQIKEKLLPIEDVRQILYEKNSDFWPQENSDDKILVLYYLGSAGKYKLYCTSLFWAVGTQRETDRLVIFKDDKYVGHYYGIDCHNSFIRDGKLIFLDYKNYPEYGYEIDFSKGIPKSAYLYGETYGFAEAENICNTEEK